MKSFDIDTMRPREYNPSGIKNRKYYVLLVTSVLGPGVD